MRLLSCKAVSAKRYGAGQVVEFLNGARHTFPPEFARAARRSAPVALAA